MVGEGGGDRGVTDTLIPCASIYLASHCEQPLTRQEFDFLEASTDNKGSGVENPYINLMS